MGIRKIYIFYVLFCAAVVIDARSDELLSPCHLQERNLENSVLMHTMGVVEEFIQKLDKCDEARAIQPNPDTTMLSWSDFKNCSCEGLSSFKERLNHTWQRLKNPILIVIDLLNDFNSPSFQKIDDIKNYLKNIYATYPNLTEHEKMIMFCSVATDIALNATLAIATKTGFGKIKQLRLRKLSQRKMIIKNSLNSLALKMNKLRNDFFQAMKKFSKKRDQRYFDSFSLEASQLDGAPISFQIPINVTPADEVNFLNSAFKELQEKLKNKMKTINSELDSLNSHQQLILD
jgi:hypothetical protein